jgi:hypothetical protein
MSEGTKGAGSLSIPFLVLTPFRLPSYHEQKSLIEMIGFMHERGFRLVNLG